MNFARPMISFSLLATLLWAACADAGPSADAAPPPPTPAVKPRTVEAIADSLYLTLTPGARAAQIIMTASATAPKMGMSYDTAAALVRDGVVGSVLFLKGKASEFRGQGERLTNLAVAKGAPKLLYACDCEPTLLHKKWTDVDSVLPASKQRDTATVARETRAINGQMKAAGVQLNFAPIADRAANKAIINRRSFGSNPDSIVALASAFVRAAQADGIGATVKHFPGHGMVAGDSHKGTVTIDGELKELDAFRRVIAGSKPMAVMVGHITVKNNARWSTAGLPASLSRPIMTTLLRGELAYDGLIVTDALNMAAAEVHGDAGWRALAAGADIALMPAFPRKLHARIVAAMAKDDATGKQLQASVKRVLRAKIALGILR